MIESLADFLARKIALYPYSSYPISVIQQWIDEYQAEYRIRLCIESDESE